MLLTARYVLPVATPHIVDGAVLVRDDKIVEIGDLEHMRKLHPDEPIRDFGLAALMPGFVDMHTHLEYTAMRGLVDDLPYSKWKLQVMHKEGLFSGQDWDDSACLGAMEALQSGITTVADITDTGSSGHAAQGAGLRAIIYRQVATMDRKKVDDVMKRATEDISAWRETSNGALMSIGIAPHAPYSCHPELFSRVAGYAMDGTAVAIHLAGSVEEYQFVKYGSSMLAIDVRDSYNADAPAWLPTGVSPVRYVLQWGLFDVPNIMAVHCTQVDAEDIDLLAEKNVSIAHCPRCEAKLAMGVAPVERFWRAGLRVGLGTDSPAASNSTDVFEEMRLGLLIQRANMGEDKFMSARQFVKMATLDAARALGLDEQIGSLEPGKQADIIAVDLSKSHQIPTHYPYSALVHTANQENVLATMVAGRFLYEDRTWHSMDRDRLYARAEEMRMKLRT
jgi:5-methylthioadenosine/S-adenosylhomocysteine deaminase